MAHLKFSLLILLFFVLSLSTYKTEALTTKINYRFDSTVIPKFDTISYDVIEEGQSFHKEKVTRKSRKLLEDLVQLDYDYAGPNPKHDPRKGRGGRSL
ncbi:hypothetical protein RND81_05G101800 [Saponaria officinalis]|uniref:Transmembrane protein n=1 Tax=Saponaria officinalis TaxID=3572 RepID=A0AAW1KV45_SAPOF